MKANRLRWFLLLLVVGAVFQLPAQQTEADRKRFEEIKAPAQKGGAEANASSAFAIMRVRVWLKTPPKR